MLLLRRADRDDEDLVLRLRNEPSTRQASFSTTEISRDDHHVWFRRKLEDPDCALLIVEEDGQGVGQVRIDRIRKDLAEISIGLAPEARGRGIGREALRLAASEAFQLLGVREVRAHIKKDNAASLEAFGAAGFRVVAETDTGVVEVLRGPDVGASPH